MWLVLESADGAPAAVPGALALAAQSMSAPERQRLDAALVEVGRRLDVRANPLADDFDDEPPDAQLRRLLPAALPKLTAAEALLSPSWRGSGGGFTVRAAVRCPAEARCIDPFARGGDDDARRARFLAWPVAGGALLEFPDAATARQAADRLRAKAAAKESRIALVLPASDASLSSLAEHARHLSHRLRQAGGEARLTGLLDDATPPRLPAWLQLDPRRILVIPRLGSVAVLTSFTAEIDAIVPDAVWLRRPPAFD